MWPASSSTSSARIRDPRRASARRARGCARGRDGPGRSGSAPDAAEVLERARARVRARRLDRGRVGRLRAIARYSASFVRRRRVAEEARHDRLHGLLVPRRGRDLVGPRERGRRICRCAAGRHQQQPRARAAGGGARSAGPPRRPSSRRPARPARAHARRAGPRARRRSASIVYGPASARNPRSPAGRAPGRGRPRRETVEGRRPVGGRLAVAVDADDGRSPSGALDHMHAGLARSSSDRAPSWPRPSARRAADLLSSAFWICCWVKRSHSLYQGALTFSGRARCRTAGSARRGPTRPSCAP